MSLIIIITNVSNLAAVSDYNYEVLVGNGTVAHSVTITTGIIQGHKRADGWKNLVQMVLDHENSNAGGFVRVEPCPMSHPDSNGSLPCILAHGHSGVHLYSGRLPSRKRKRR